MKRNQKQAILVQTQTVENYGAHAEDGKAVNGNAYWKFKGGDQFLVHGTADRPANAVALVFAICGRNDIGMKEYPCGYEVVSEDYEPEDEYLADRIRSIHVDKPETWKSGDYDPEKWEVIEERINRMKLTAEIEEKVAPAMKGVADWSLYSTEALQSVLKTLSEASWRNGSTISEIQEAGRQQFLKDFACE